MRNSMVISLKCDFSVKEKKFKMYTCFMIISKKCLHSKRIKDSDYCFENNFLSELKLKIRKILIWIICSHGREEHYRFSQSILIKF